MINLGTNSGSNCPNIRLKPGVIDRILEVLALLVQLATWGFAYWIYTNGTISPEIWLLCGVATFTSILLGACAYASVKLINFPVRVNERNIAVQYLLAVRFLRILNILMGIFFVAIAFKVYYQPAPIFFGITLGLQVVAFLVYFIMANKYK